MAGGGGPGRGTATVGDQAAVREVPHGVAVGGRHGQPGSGMSRRDAELRKPSPWYARPEPLDLRLDRLGVLPLGVLIPDELPEQAQVRVPEALERLELDAQGGLDHRRLSE